MEGYFPILSWLFLPFVVFLCFFYEIISFLSMFQADRFLQFDLSALGVLVGINERIIDQFPFDTQIMPQIFHPKRHSLALV